jgi:hypothetical protein
MLYYNSMATPMVSNLKNLSALGMCYILCMTSTIGFYIASGTQRGDSPPMMGFGGNTLDKKKSSVNMSHCFLIFGVTLIFVSIVGRFFSTWFFVNLHLFLVKELGLLTNPGH